MSDENRDSSGWRTNKEADGCQAANAAAYFDGVGKEVHFEMLSLFEREKIHKTSSGTLSTNVGFYGRLSIPAQG